MCAKNTITVFLLAITCLQCSTYQNATSTSPNNRFSSSNSDSKSGACYGKCLIPDQIELRTKEYPIFTGDELEENVEVAIKEIEIEPKSTRWVKKRADKNCLSRNPEDCLVWCLEEVAPVIKEIKILVDTTSSSNYELQSIEYQHVVSKGGHTEWREVLCSEDLSQIVISQIKNLLKAEGYFVGGPPDQIDKETKESLVQFQRDNNLPICSLDIETLDLLGVIVPPN